MGSRDQARRLIGRIGNNRVKLGEAARILQARLPSRSVSKAHNPAEEEKACVQYVRHTIKGLVDRLYRPDALHGRTILREILKAELPKKVIRSYTGTKLVFGA